MESDLPPTDPDAPTTPGGPPNESAHDRHLREMEESFETLGHNVEHGLARMLKIAVPVLAGVILAAIGTYVLGNYLKDRAARRRVAKQMKVVRAERIVRAERLLGRRSGFRARRRSAPAVVDGPLSPSEASEIIGGVLAEVDA